MPRTKEAFQQIRDESRQHILDKAAKVFTEKGLAFTKISDLADAAGISQGLLYRYFNSKEDVFVGLLECAIHGASERARAAIEFPGTPWEKLKSLTDQALQDMSQEPVSHQIISQALALSGKAQETIKELVNLKDSLRKLIIEGQAAGQIVNRDPDQLVLLYLCCMYGLSASTSILHRGIFGHFPDAEAVLQIVKL